MLFFLAANVHSVAHAAISVLPETPDVGSVVAFDNPPGGWEVRCFITRGSLFGFYRR